MTQAEVAKLFMVINYSYPAFSIDETKILIWHELLSDFPFEAAQINLRQHINTKLFSPVPAEIRNPPYRDPEVNVDHAKRLADTMLYLDEVDKQRAQIAPPPWLNGGTG